MFVVGFVPAFLYARYRTFSPIVATGGLLGVTAFATWQTVQSGSTPVDPTPFGWYMLLWIGVLVLDAALGGVEFWVWRSSNN
ncbi:hypothetical protein C455_08517 [Haloferax larsenii JCM 13917]|nr:hypothetical protein C455_08517 [Haloferax larsenii JCM 13917]